MDNCADTGFCGLIGYSTFFSQLLPHYQDMETHQISALALAKFQQDAFSQTDLLQIEEAKEAWRQDMTEKSPRFQYWNTVLRLEVLVLTFVRTHCKGNFQLYVEALKTSAP